MVTIIGVRFRNAGKIYYFDPGDKKIPRGTSVIVETARGFEMGTVIVPNKEVEDESVVQPLKPVIRIANEDDFNIIKENKLKQKEAYFICKEKIRKHDLQMKLVDVEYTFDNNKILFIIILIFQRQFVFSQWICLYYKTNEISKKQECNLYVISPLRLAIQVQT